jgi:hypothetical protein
MSEPPERFIDQGDVRFAEQMMDILRRSKHDPVERQFEEIGAGLHVRAAIPLGRMLSVKLLYLYHRSPPPGLRSPNCNFLRAFPMFIAFD